MLKIALLGHSGVGKTTFYDYSKSFLKKLNKDLNIVKIKFARPIYQIQAQIYQFCDTKLPSSGQDAALLGYLGKKFRDLNESSLVNIFAAQLNKLRTDENADNTVVICDDASASELDFLLDEGFTVIYINSKHEIAKNRIHKRGDGNISEISSDFDEPAIWMYHYKVENNGSKADFKRKVKSILEIVAADYYDSHR